MKSEDFRNEKMKVRSLRKPRKAKKMFWIDKSYVYQGDANMLDDVG